ncbi:MAG: lipopolysaccharide transport periplasmic protein LptA [Paracoccaceae bacterium]
MLFHLRALSLGALLAVLAGGAIAQGAQVAFGGLKQDNTLPVQVAADQLRVDQSSGRAVFSGNVAVVQGAMTLKADEVEVIYGEGGASGGRIDELQARGHVTLVSATDAAEAETAVYRVATGQVEMTGNVLLTQGQNALSGQKLVVDLRTGNGTMEGRVQTLFQPGATTP